MPTYSVALPVTGIIYVEVEADNEAQAIDVALSEPGNEPDEWEVHRQIVHHRQIVQGNVFYGILNKPEVEEVG